MPARGDDDCDPPQDELLAELARLQPLLAVINAAAALVLAFALASDAAEPIPALSIWLGCVAFSQASRLVCWPRWRRATAAGLPTRDAAGWLVTTSAAAGFCWGLAGLLFAGPGLGAGPQPMLVPLFLTTFAAGAVAALAGHLPTFYAFTGPTLPPYALRGALADEPAAHAVGLTMLAYVVGLSAVAHRVHRSLRRSVELRLESARRTREVERVRLDLERRVARGTAELETVMATVPVALWIAHDPEATRVTGSQRAAEMLRLGQPDNHSLTASEAERPRHFRVLSDGEEVTPSELPLQRAARGEAVRDEEVRVLFDDGTFFDELVSAAPVHDVHGNVVGAVGAAVDITGRKRAEEALRQSEQRFRDFAVAASDWFWETDAEHRLVWVSANVEELTSVSRERLYGKTWLELMAPGTDPALIERHRRTLEAHHPFRELEYPRRGPAGEMWLSASGVPVFDLGGRFAGYRGVARDIGVRKKAEERVKHLAEHDALTGLPNRYLLQDRLNQAMAVASRDGAKVGLLLLDLDDFKDVNDTLGHPAGDRLLGLVARRLKAILRATDTLARLGGDEFAVVQPNLGVPGGAAALARKMVETFTAPFSLDSHEVRVGVSVGVALFPDDGRDADELLKNADLALYRAKREGRGRCRFFESAMNAEVQARHQLGHELRRALDQGDFVLHYQPQLDLATGRMGGLEALVRWRHPERGLVLPGEFVPAAEASGLIRPLGAWVLGEACRQAKVWCDAGLAVTVAVNLSPVQLYQDGAGLHAVDGALRVSGLDPSWLELEITEGLLLDSSDRATGRALCALAARGVRLALDDFGTGYSSLAYLKRLPVQTIKVDRSFVHDIGTDPEDEAVVRAIVSLGHALGKRVVAEGVESQAQLKFLRELGCDAAQGFLLGRPRAAEEVNRLLAPTGRIGPRLLLTGA